MIRQILLRLRPTKQSHNEISEWLNHLPSSNGGYRLEVNEHVEAALLQYIRANPIEGLRSPDLRPSINAKPTLTAAIEENPFVDKEVFNHPGSSDDLNACEIPPALIKSKQKIRTQADKARFKNAMKRISFDSDE